MVKNKRGWIRIIEAFIAITLMVSLVFVILGGGKFNENVSSLIETKQSEILKQVQINQTIRDLVLSTTTFPIDSNDTNFPDLIKTFLAENLDDSDCLMVICAYPNVCPTDTNVADQVYYKDIFIFSNKTEYSPRRVAMVCYKN